jgi:hypothetical protein
MSSDWMLRRRGKWRKRRLDEQHGTSVEKICPGPKSGNYPKTGSDWDRGSECKTRSIVLCNVIPREIKSEVSNAKKSARMLKLTPSNSASVSRNTISVTVVNG